MCKKGLGATEWLWVGWTSNEGGTCYRALGLINSQLIPGQRRTREDWHRPRHHRTFTAYGSTGRRFVITASLYGQYRGPKIQLLCHRGTLFQIFEKGSHSLGWNQTKIYVVKRLNIFSHLSSKNSGKKFLASSFSWEDLLLFVFFYSKLNTFLARQNKISEDVTFKVVVF